MQRRPQQLLQGRLRRGNPLTFAERQVSTGSRRSGCWELLPPQRTAPCSSPGATQETQISSWISVSSLQRTSSFPSCFLSSCWYRAQLRADLRLKLSCYHTHCCQCPQPHVESSHRSSWQSLTFWRREAGERSQASALSVVQQTPRSL